MIHRKKCSLQIHQPGKEMPSQIIPLAACALFLLLAPPSHAQVAPNGVNQSGSSSQANVTNYITNNITNVYNSGPSKAHKKTLPQQEDSSQVFVPTPSVGVAEESSQVFVPDFHGAAEESSQVFVPVIRVKRH
jgi:hypothetical protein